ncbi:MAG: hypothetical protein GYB66_07835 [Chloroflexi bacterium]|nr:hypothetical protein [Chloroflexota bacterium]
MLSRWRLPPDTFPDDTETRAFQTYHEDKATAAPRSLVTRRWRLLAAIGLLVGIMTVISMEVLALLDDGETTYIIVPGEPLSPGPTLDPGAAFDNGFPEAVDARQVITVPTRIDHTLSAGQKQGYIFRAPAALAWQITVVSTGGGLTPTVRLYGPPNSALIETQTASSASQTASLTFTSTPGTAYAVVVAGATPTTAGTYTIRILPSQ